MRARADASTLLAGLRVVELAVAPSLPMSLTGKLLADLGADVTVVGIDGYPTAGDAAGPAGEWAHLLRLLTAGKRQLVTSRPVTADPDVQRAIRDADIVLAPPRSAAEPAGASYEAVAAVDPTVVYGVAEPYSDGVTAPASDLVLQAMGGMLSTTGQPGEPPTRVGARVADHLGALYLGIGCLAGLAARRNRGTGRLVSVSLVDALVSSLNNHVAEYTGKGHLPPTLGNRHLASSPWNLYPASDGFVVICLITDRQWDQLADVMGRPDLVGNPGFHGQHVRRPKADEIDALVADWTRTRTVAEILSVLSARGVPCGDIAEIDDVLADDSLYERGLLRLLPDGERVLGPLVRIARAVEADAIEVGGVHPGEASDEDRALGSPGEDGRPLAGLRVVEIGVAAAGPVAGRILANLGADVVKVEPAKGEIGRRVPPLVGTTSAVFHLNSSDKRSICLELTDETGMGVTRRLVQRSDVVVENLAPGRLAGWGLDFDASAQANPGLIWTSVSGFGQTATGRRLRAYDTVVQAASGLMSLTGFPQGIPTKAGISLSDFFGGVSGAFATLAALTARDIGRVEGLPPVARQLDVSMHATTVWTTMAAWPSVLLGGQPLQRTGNVDRYERWQGIVECRDGSIAVTVHDDADERAARKVASGLGTEPIDVASTLERWAGKQSVAAAVDTLRAAGVAAGPLRSVIDLMADAGLRSRAVLTTSRHSADGDVAVMAAPINFSDIAPQTPLPAPVLGGDTTAVLRERAGYSDVEVAELLASNAVLQANGPDS